MRTVEELINELKKFPPHAECEAYEGETIGITVSLPQERKYGFIYCDENDIQAETETF